jgi:S1-C subfamily serine protease
MRYILISLTIIALLANSVLADSFGEKLAHKTVTVLANGGIGAGVIYKNYGKTYVWSAAHVTPGGISEEFQYRVYQDVYHDGIYSHRNNCRAKCIGYSPLNGGKDLSILELEDENFGEDSTTFLDGIAVVGEPIWACGTPLGRYHNSLSNGIVSFNGRKDRGAELDQGSMEYREGSSGGPIFDSDGRCVGLLSRGEGYGAGLYVPSRVMFKWAPAFVK